MRTFAKPNILETKPTPKQFQAHAQTLMDIRNHYGPPGALPPPASRPPANHRKGFFQIFQEYESYNNYNFHNSNLHRNVFSTPC